MPRAHTTEFLFNNGDYFVAKTDSGDVRIGLVGGTCYDVPAGHAYFDRIVDAAHPAMGAAVEELHDELTSALA